jgi:hypothetical protein
VLVSAAEASLAPVAQIDGFRLASIIDASTGMILAAAGDEEDLSLATVAAGAADMAQVLSMVSGELGSDDGLEDVMVTFGTHFHVIRLIQADARQQVVLLVVLDRARANLALARREIRDFCAGVAS